MTGAEVAIVVSELTKRYDGSPVVDSISFEVDRGMVFGFLGLNGAGKTTTIKMLCGRLLPSSGHSSVLGLDPAKQEKQLARKIGVLSDELGLYRDMTVKANLDFFASLYDLKSTRVGKVVSMMGLESHEKKRVSALSKGLVQRTRLAKCILNDPDLIFLDEPMTGLDVDIAKEIEQLIRDFARGGKTVFLTTHNMAEIETLCSDIAVIDGGVIRARMSMREVRRRGRGDVDVEFPDRIERVSMSELGRYLLAHPEAEAVASRQGTVEDMFLEVIGKHHAD